MKTVEDWEQKREAVLQAIAQFDRKCADKCHRMAPRRGGLSHRAWANIYRAWIVSEKSAHAVTRKRIKLARRLAYIESRIRATTPTFWAKL